MNGEKLKIWQDQNSLKPYWLNFFKSRLEFHFHFPLELKVKNYFFK